MNRERNILQKYKWTIGTTLVWLLLMGITFGIEKEEASPATIGIALFALVLYQALFGIHLDKKSQKNYTARQEKQQRERKELGETTWRAQEEGQAAQKKILRRENWLALFIDLAGGAVYLVLARLVFGGGTRWIRREMPGLLWFLIGFYTTAYWITSFSRRKQKNVIKPMELVLLFPFALLPFGPLFRMLPEKYLAVCILLVLSWEFSAFAIGFLLQAKNRHRDCTVPTTATVVDNKKSIIGSADEADSIPVPTYQPVLDYYADGEWRHIICDDGQPRPLEPGLVVKIYYNPHNPYEFRFDDNQKTYTDKYATPLLGGIGVITLLAAIFIGYFI